MSAYATVLASMGHHVTGSDLKGSAGLERLRASGIDVQIGHHPEVVPGADVVAISSAVPGSDPELVEARRLGIPVVSRADLLAGICAQRRVVAVSGTHGKTTTTSMLALILVEAQLRPSFLIGGDVNEIGTNAVWDDGSWLVVEADESDGTFLRLAPEAALVTNIDEDHLDHHGTYAQLLEAFDRFAAQCRGPLVVNVDDPTAAALARRHGAISVGYATDADFQIRRCAAAPQTPTFELWAAGEQVARIVLAVPGAHNIANAAAAAVTASQIGADLGAAQRALARFAGVARRFEVRGEVGGARLVDDYAHLPAEVAATIAAAREDHHGRLLAVFQPHRFSRTAAMAARFGAAFAGADVVVVTDVYGAGEPAVPGVTGQMVADAIAGTAPSVEVHYVPSRQELASVVAALLRPGDLCLVMGAGDVSALCGQLLGGRR